ncbi:MAG: hypothetical protein N4A71_08255 [Carboxylicivirga sp.]|jgi:biotin operon repressor|nr:hypothetical protein [Carboxylicivirga sp.]
MKILEEVDMLKRMFELIDKKQTGCSCSFHKKLGISRGKFYNIIDDLRNKGINVKYDKTIKSFYIHGNICVNVNEPIQIISKEEESFINGGFFISVHFFGQTMT